MKKELAGVELAYIIKELQILIDGKIDKIYQIDRNELLFVFHKTGIGKQMLRIALPSFMYLTKHKGTTPEKPPGFCLFLRKHLGSARLRRIEQVGFERIVEFTFDTKDGEKVLIIELFSQGNAILCKDKKIISALESQKWKDRTVRGGIDYQLPALKDDLRKIDKATIKSIINKSDKDLVKTLAVELGLGGRYAEELCYIAKIGKDRKTLQEKDADALIKAIKKLFAKKIKPTIYSLKGNIKDITPFEVKSFEKKKAEMKKENKETYNEALDSIISVKKVEQKEKAFLNKYDKQIGKLQRMIDSQEKQIKQMEKQAVEEQQKAELIYENYQMVEDILKELKKARAKFTWDEITKKLKGHKVIKQINAKNNEIIVEL